MLNFQQILGGMTPEGQKQSSGVSQPWMQQARQPPASSIIAPVAGGAAAPVSSPAKPADPMAAANPQQPFDVAGLAGKLLPQLFGGAGGLAAGTDYAPLLKLLFGGGAPAGGAAQELGNFNPTQGAVDAFGGGGFGGKSGVEATGKVFSGAGSSGGMGNLFGLFG